MKTIQIVILGFLFLFHSKGFCAAQAERISVSDIEARVTRHLENLAYDTYALRRDAVDVLNAKIMPWGDKSLVVNEERLRSILPDTAGLSVRERALVEYLSQRVEGVLRKVVEDLNGLPSITSDPDLFVSFEVPGIAFGTMIPNDERFKEVLNLITAWDQRKAEGSAFEIFLDSGFINESGTLLTWVTDRCNVEFVKKNGELMAVHSALLPILEAWAAGAEAPQPLLDQFKGQIGVRAVQQIDPVLQAEAEKANAQAREQERRQALALERENLEQPCFPDGSKPSVEQKLRACMSNSTMHNEAIMDLCAHWEDFSTFHDIFMGQCYARGITPISEEALRERLAQDGLGQVSDYLDTQISLYLPDHFLYQRDQKDLREVLRWIAGIRDAYHDEGSLVGYKGVVNPKVLEELDARYGMIMALLQDHLGKCNFGASARRFYFELIMLDFWLNHHPDAPSRF